MFSAREIIESNFDPATVKKIERVVFGVLALNLVHSFYKNKKLPGGYRVNVDTDAITDYVTEYLGLHPASQKVIRGMVRKAVDQWQSAKPQKK